MKIAVKTSLTQLEETGDGVCFQVKSPLMKKEFLTDITERYNRGNRGNK